MYLKGFRPLQRGEVSILAAFSLVVILAGAGLLLQSISPTAQQAQTAAANASTGDTSVNQITQNCAAAIASAKAAGKETTSKVGQTANDNCVAAVLDTSKTNPNPKDSSSYKCVGKSAQVMVNSDGTMTVNWQANPNVAPGTCKTVACQPDTSSVGTAMQAKCVATELQSLNKSDISTSLGSPNAFDVNRSVGGLFGAFGVTSTLQPATPLSQSQSDLINAALGRDPNNTTGAIPLDSSGNMVPTPYSQIAQYAADNPDPNAAAASQQTTGAALQLNGNLADTSMLSGNGTCSFAGQSIGCGTGDNGQTEYYPGDAVEQKALTDAGYACTGDINGPDGSVTCNKGLAYQGPCPNGATMNPATGACSGGAPVYQGPCPNGATMNPTTGACGVAAPPCAGSLCNQQQQVQQPANPLGNSSALNSLLNGLSRGLATAPIAPAAAPAAAQTCSTDPNTYAQQQQQYQQQLQQYNYQLQQAQYQQQMNQYYASQNGGIAPPAQPLPAQPVACTPSTQQQCSVQPQQPAASTCTNGSWQPIYSGNCVVNWQCSNLGAQLSCSPSTADVGMSLAITYSCAQGTASGSGFTASGQSGTSTAVVAAPPQGTNTATYSLTCNNGIQTSGAQCSIQVTQPSIVLVANPGTIASGQTSQLGWVTVGMQACVISSPQDVNFTAQNASNTSVSGTATTLAATSTQSYILNCQTLAGGAKSATTTVTVQ